MDSKADPKACDHYDRHSVRSNNAVVSWLGSATSGTWRGAWECGQVWELRRRPSRFVIDCLLRGGR